MDFRQKIIDLAFEINNSTNPDRLYLSRILFSAACAMDFNKLEELSLLCKTAFLDLTGPHRIEDQDGIKSDLILNFDDPLKV